MFTRAYIQGSWTPAVCIPSRTMLITGLPLWRAQARSSEVAHAARTWPQLLRASGYRTAFVGKWHVQGAKPEDIFEDAGPTGAGLLGSNPKHWYGRPVEGRPAPFDPCNPAEGGYWRKDDRHWTQVQADEVAAAVRRARADGRPWLVYAIFNAARSAVVAAGMLGGLSPRVSPLARKFPARTRRRCCDGCGAGAAGRKPRSLSPHSVRHPNASPRVLRDHLAFRCADWPSPAGGGTHGSSNTYIILASDNGLACGRHGLMGKQNMYEHSVRVPLVVSGPGVPVGVRCDEPVYMQDLAATTLDLAGVAVPPEWAWRSLRPLLTNPMGPGRGYVCGAYMDRQRMIVDRRWKLILYPAAGRASLFDLEHDPLETEDRLGDPAARTIACRMFARLLELQNETAGSLEQASRSGEALRPSRFSRSRRPWWGRSSRLSWPPPSPAGLSGAGRAATASPWRPACCGPGRREGRRRRGRSTASGAAGRLRSSRGAAS